MKRISALLEEIPARVLVARVLVSMTLLAALFVGVVQAQATPLTNGDFETRDLSSWTAFTITNGTVGGSGFPRVVLFDTETVEEVIIDFTAVGSQVPFAHDHFEAVGILFTVSSEFIGFIQGDDALVATLGGQISADIPRGFSDISVSVAASFQGSWEFTLTALNNVGGVVDQASVSVEEGGSAGYQMLSLSDLSGAVSFDIRGIKDGDPTEFGVNLIKFTPAPIAIVDVDVKPGSDPNSINCNNFKGVIAVAILTVEGFDATTVDHTTVTFEGAVETHVAKKSGEPRRHEEDVDHDGDVDLVFHFRLGDTTLTCDSTQAALTGETFDGQAIEGSDSVRMIDRGGGPPFVSPVAP